MNPTENAVEWSMGSVWRIELLGGLTARRGDHYEDRFIYRKAGELLAYLSLSPGHEFNRDDLLAILWPDDDDIDALRVRFRQIVKSLRRQIEPPDVEPGSLLITDRESISLNRAGFECDVIDFEIEVSLAKRCPPDKIERHLEKAAAFYRGEFLRGYSADWITSKLSELQEDFLNVADELSEFKRKRGAWDEAILLQKRTAQIECYDEVRHQQLISSLKEANRFSEALQAYEDFKARLARDLGGVPTPETEELARSIELLLRQGAKPAIASSKDRDDKSTRQVAKRFPVPLTRFFGRGDEVLGLQTILADPSNRLLTMLGAGGSGKTRLALELAEALFYEREGDIWFVALADLTHPNEIPNATMAAMRISKEGGQAIDYIVDELSQCDRPLIIFDNFEHLVEGGADFIRDLIQRLPNLTCVITSRHRLNLDGEHEMQISLLAVPPEGDHTPDELLQFPGVQLFADRAKMARADFKVTTRNADAVGELCRKLEGIPLALELCAALSGTVTPAQMLSGLQKRFVLLVSRRRDIVPRHRTLRAAIEYSYQMLPSELATIFKNASIFQGWSALTFEGVLKVKEVHTTLQELQGRSLIIAAELSSCADEVRYKMLETLREFAWEKLVEDEQEQLARDHLAYFRLFVDTQTKAGDFQPISQEWNNIRAAMRWALADQNLRSALEFCCSLYPYTVNFGDAIEGWNMFEAVFTNPGIELIAIESQCRAAELQTRLALNQVGRERLEISSRRWLNMAEKLNDLHQICLSKNYVGVSTGNSETLEDALTIAASLNDPGLQALITINLAAELKREGISDRSEELLRQSLLAAEAAGEKRPVAYALLHLAAILSERGDHEQALTSVKRSLALSEEIGHEYLRLRCLNEIASEELVCGRFTESARLLITAIGESASSRKTSATAYAVQTGACLLSAIGAFEQSALLFGAAESVGTLVGINLSEAEGEWGFVKKYLLATQSELGNGYEQFWNEGRQMIYRQSVEAAVAALKPASLLPELSHA